MKEKQTRVLRVLLSKTEKRMLQELSAGTGLTMSSVIRQAIRRSHADGRQEKKTRT